MRTVETIHDFAQMHLDLGLPMPKGTFRETIPMVHSIPSSFPTVREMFGKFLIKEHYVLTYKEAVGLRNELRAKWEEAINIDYKGFGAGSIFKDQLVRYSQTDEGKAYGLQTTRNFRLGGAIHFETNAQAERFLADWISVRRGEEE
jgi:hypothetical protein